MDDISIDRTDKKIITMLQKNSRISLKDIASQNYMSSPAVASRISKMQEIGLIKNFTTEIDYSLIGFHIKAFINLEVAPKDKNKFYSFIQNIPNVIECSCVTGDYSMLIQVLYNRPEELDHLINEFQQFGRTKTLIAFSTSIDHRPLLII